VKLVVLLVNSYWKPYYDPNMMAYVIAQGDPQDRVSDLNCFWMAKDPEILMIFLQIQKKNREVFSIYEQSAGFIIWGWGHDKYHNRFQTQKKKQKKTKKKN